MLRMEERQLFHYSSIGQKGVRLESGLENSGDLEFLNIKIQGAQTGMIAGRLDALSPCRV
jgi:hypothetical protein